MITQINVIFLLIIIFVTGILFGIGIESVKSRSSEDGLRACRIGLERCDSKLEAINDWMKAASSCTGIGGPRK